MTNITICLVYFRSLALANLAASLYSVLRQDLTHVNSIVLLDNNTADSYRSILDVVDRAEPKIPVYVSSYKHGDNTKTHAWSTNVAVERTQTSWIFFTRADYLLEQHALATFQSVAQQKTDEWNGYITSYGYHLGVDIGYVEQTLWRHGTFPDLPGALVDYGHVDTGVWMMPRRVFNSVGGLDERLTAWGHAQTHFQWKLHQTGTEVVCIPQRLYYHPLHDAPRDITKAHAQLAALGVDLKDMWQRHPGVY